MAVELTVRLAESTADLERASRVMTELRTQLTAVQVLEQIGLQQREGYQLAICESADRVLGAAGFVISHKLAWGKALYVDDLITTQTARSQGVGARLLAWLKRYAQQQGCQQLHLDSGVQRFAAHKFYLLHGFSIASHHFSITDLQRVAHDAG